VNGRYWSQFDRLDPLDGPAREQAWTGVAHGLIAELTLSDGAVVERDLRDLLQGPLLGRLADDDHLFRLVSVGYGTLVWPGEIDIAPETLIWDGPAPRDEARLTPAAFLRPQPPR
jgi:hypothetical protein